MTGFFVLDVPEFKSLIAAAQKNAACVVHPLIAGYRFVEFENEIEIRRCDTQMNEAVWFGCLTAGLIGKIAKFDKDSLKLVATNEPILMPLSDGS
jgi:hypothetical protein